MNETKKKPTQQPESTGPRVKKGELFGGAGGADPIRELTNAWADAVERLRGQQFASIEVAVGAIADEIERRIGASPGTRTEERAILELLVKTEPQFEAALRAELQIKG